MKKLMILIVAAIFTVNAMAQDAVAGAAITKKSINPNNIYCASLKKDGKMTVQYEEKELIKEVTLVNGIKITPDGYLVKKDGTRTAMLDGQCLDKDGNTVPNPKDKVNDDVMPDIK